jgi:hypothetical protein
MGGRMSSAPALSLSSVVVRSPDQVSGDLDGKVVLLSVQNGEYYNMNEVGSTVWSLVEQPISVAQLVEKLLAEFDVDRARCEGEVLVFLERLRKDGLIRVE